VTTRDLLDSQDALLEAQNSVTTVLLDYAIAKLSFFRDVGILQVRPDGMWEHTYPVKKTDVGETSVEPKSQSETISSS
jgi:hypothetical protein